MRRVDEKMAAEPKDCPCGSGARYSACCKPYHTGAAQPPTAEALMRARYSAFATSNADYIRDTLHPRARKDHDDDAVRRWAKESEWLGFEIVETRAGGVDDTRGTVEFIAHYKVNGEVNDHHERAEFARVDGRWTFVDGKQLAGQPVVREAPKVGRNDPCPCGSGKKYKQCHGRAGAAP